MKTPQTPEDLEQMADGAILKLSEMIARYFAKEVLDLQKQLLFTQERLARQTLANAQAAQQAADRIARRVQAFLG